MPRRTTAEPSGPAYFVDATAASGLSRTNVPCALDPERQYFVTGQAWGDVNGDGAADLYLTSQCGASSLFLGRGDGSFELSPLAWQVDLVGRQAGGAVFADLDDDGWPDLLVLTYDGPVLFHNDAGQGLRDVTADAGLVAIPGAHPVSAALADYDGDGALDVFLSNYGCTRCLASPLDEVPSQLFHNLGNGRFEDATPLLGVQPVGFSFAASWIDFDDDGDQDLYVTNDVRGGRTLQGNHLYRNDGSGCLAWCFTDVSASAGAAVRADSMGLAIADFTGDGALDVFITNSGWAYTPLTGPSILLANQGNGSFRDASSTTNAEVDAMAWGAAALDVNNDGWPDLYVALGTDPAEQGGLATTNRLLRNEGKGRFVDATARSGAADVGDSFGVAIGDANADGQADLVVGDYNSGYRLYLGTGGGDTAGHRLVVKLRGAGPVNQEAVGARIEVTLSDGRRLVHDVELGGTLGGNHETTYRTGTGQAHVSRLSVRWPDGLIQTLDDVPTDVEVHWTYAGLPAFGALPAIAVRAEQTVEPRESTGLASALPLVATVIALLALFVATAGQPVGTTPEPANPGGESASSPRRGRLLRLLGTEYPLVLPSPRDPRLHLAAVITSLHVLGQTVFGFQLSIAQILVSLLTAGLIEFALTFKSSRALVWPASAMVAGNGVAFILRVPGTQHGDWWSLNGFYLFAGVAAVSVLSKRFLRQDGQHVFNPSNFGLVLAFLILGSDRVEPLDFWWGPVSPALIVAYAIILVGGLAILLRLRLIWMALAFYLTLGVALSATAAAGHCMSAKWSLEPVCGASFWRTLLTSPELLVFTFFMLTDPRTTPSGSQARIVFGVCVALVAAIFIAPQQTEFDAKVALLASLFVACAARPSVEAMLQRVPRFRRSAAWRLRGESNAPAWRRATAAGVLAAGILVLSLGLLPAFGAPARQAAAELQPAASTLGRPEGSIDRSALPSVEIDAGLLRIDPDIDDARAAAMGLDVAVDLEVEARAILGADAELLKTVAAGSRLRNLQHELDAVRRGREPRIDEYTFERMRLVLVYDPQNAQAGPRYGLETRGTVRRRTYDGIGSVRVARQEEVPFERTFALLLREGHYLIAADYPPSRP